MIRWRNRRPVESLVEEAWPYSGSTPLHKYLSERYAESVVLTFQEIEDLLGFELPEPARLNGAWWSSVDPISADPHIADAWILSHRTARPNLSARTVVFERWPY